MFGIFKKRAKKSAGSLITYNPPIVTIFRQPKGWLPCNGSPVVKFDQSIIAEYIGRRGYTISLKTFWHLMEREYRNEPPIKKYKVFSRVLFRRLSRKNWGNPMMMMDVDNLMSCYDRGEKLATFYVF